MLNLHRRLFASVHLAFTQNCINSNIHLSLRVHSDLMMMWCLQPLMVSAFEHQAGQHRQTQNCVRSFTQIKWVGHNVTAKRIKTDAAELQIVFFTPYNLLPTVRLEIQVCYASSG